MKLEILLIYNLTAKFIKQAHHSFSMKAFNERFALLLFSGFAVLLVTLQAFKTGIPLAVGLSLVAIMFLAFACVLATVEAMRKIW
ncbi:MAG: hypothetical protein ACK4NX_02075 [Candidatus Paceibacteria bacterium]